MNFEFIHSPNKQEKEELAQQLQTWSEKHYPGLKPFSEDKAFLICSRTESGEINAGIDCNCYWDGLEIKTLWVATELRNQGIGEQLVEQAEHFAKEQGAVIAYLKTLDAKRFYEKLGYEVYGTLEDRPIGTVFYHMKKRLDK